MDILKIQTKFLTGIINGFISKIIKKKTGVNVPVDLSMLSIEPIPGGDQKGYRVEFKVGFDISEKDIWRLAQNLQSLI